MTLKIAGLKAAPPSTYALPDHVFGVVINTL